MIPWWVLPLCVFAASILCFGLGAVMAQSGLAERYEEHISKHGPEFVVGCMYCGAERPHVAREVLQRIEYGPKTIHELDSLPKVADDLRRFIN